MKRKSLTIYTATAICLAAFCSLMPIVARAGTINIDLVPVGDAGNVADSRTGYGAVAYPYSIGKYDVTMGQYAAFLNSVAVSGDPYGLYSTSMATATATYGITQTSTSAGFVYAAKGNSANVPVTYVDWGDAARFVNWLANGEPAGPEGPGTTETGSYLLNGSTGSAALMAVTRSTSATWVLPMADEWYKAAYYAGGGTNAGYWNYPTQNNSVPGNALSASGTNNANFATISGNADPLDLLTPIGFFAASPGAYQTFDMGGNVYEWNETANYASFSTGRYIFGGSYASTANAMFYASAASPMPTGSSQDLGFRVESVPEPSTVVVLFFLGLEVLVWRVLFSSRSSGRSMTLQRYRSLRAESLEGRAMLSSVVKYNPNVDPSTTWENRTWLDENNSNAPVSWGSLTAPITVDITGVPPSGIDNISQITIGSSVSPSEINFEQDCAIRGAALTLTSATIVNVTPTFVATIDSTILGSYKLAKLGTGTLDIASAANSYSGGTDIVAGTLQLEKDATLHAPATLGTGGVVMGSFGAVLDLHGCSLTLPSLGDDGLATNGAIITDYVGVDGMVTMDGGTVTYL